MGKKKKKTSFMEKQNNITKNKSFECFVRFLRKKMPKWIENTVYGKNEKTLRETCIMSVFDLLSIKRVKRMNNTLYGEIDIWNDIKDAWKYPI